MIRLKMNTGKYHGVRPNDVVGMIAFHADIPGNTIGKIRIEDKHTLVDIPEQFVNKVLAENGDYRIGNTSSRWKERKCELDIRLNLISS